MPFRTLLANTTPKGKAVMAASAVALVVLMVVMFKVASAPSYATMLTGLDPAETGKITAALDEKGVGYELRNNGTALAVVKGQLLWPNGDSAAASGGGANKLTAQSRYNAQLQGSLDAMLAQTLGPGKAHAQVSSDLNVDQSTLDKLTYAKKGIPLKQTEETERLRGGGGSGAAAGSDAKSGDVLNVSQVAFAKPQAAPAASPAAGILGYAKYAAAGLGVLLF